MACDKKSNKLERCGNITPSNCVKYTGEENDCIDLCTGTSLTDVIETLGDQICTIKEEVDITDLVIQPCFGSIPTITLITVLTAIMNKDCDQDAKIAVINEQLDSFDPAISGLVLGCLVDNPCFTTSSSLSEVLNILIAEICNIRDVIADQNLVIASQSAQIAGLQTQIDVQNTTIACLNSKFNDLVTYLNTIPEYGSFTPTC